MDFLTQAFKERKRSSVIWKRDSPPYWRLRYCLGKYGTGINACGKAYHLSKSTNARHKGQVFNHTAKIWGLCSLCMSLIVQSGITPALKQRCWRHRLMSIRLPWQHFRKWLLLLLRALKLPRKHLSIYLPVKFLWWVPTQADIAHNWGFSNITDSWIYSLVALWASNIK